MGITRPIPSHGIFKPEKKTLPFLTRYENSYLAPHQDVIAALIFSSVATHRPCIAWIEAVRRQQKGGNMPNRKKPAELKKTHNLKIRLDDYQYSTIQNLAEKAGMSMTEYIRRQAVYGKVEIHNHIVADFPKLEKLTQEFSAIGNNLNQLTRYFHMGGLKSKAMTNELTRCMNEIMKMRKDVMEMAGEYRGYTQTHRK